MKKKTLWIINAITMGIMCISCLINTFVKPSEHLWFKITEGILSIVFAGFFIFWIFVTWKNSKATSENE